MRSRRIPGIFIALCALLLLILAGGCARLPPSQNALSGKRLHVTLTFAADINPGFYYYFIINRSNDMNAPGPIPVSAPISNQSYGNGFATSSSTDNSRLGFTDFVLFSTPLNHGLYRNPRDQGGYGLYHVLGNNNDDRTNFTGTGAPISFVTPNPNDVNSKTLEFEIDLSQLFTDASGNPPTDTAAVVAMARAIVWIQVNVVATNLTPIDPTTIVNKVFDSFGDNRGGQGTYINLDVSKPDSVRNGDLRFPGATESPNDIFTTVPSTESQFVQLDLVDWTIEIRQQ
jgi:hypothetical protein